jgi:hypothetical protein
VLKLNSIHRDTFIYEYIGDVVSQPSFMKRMRDYANEGIRHFYFMMLQKDEVRSLAAARAKTLNEHSSWMPRKGVALVDLRTIPVIPIAMLQSGQ